LKALLIELEDHKLSKWEDFVANANLYHSNVDEIRDNLHRVISEPYPEQIFWVEQDVKTGNSSLHVAPLHVGNLFHEHLLKPKDSVILTSATIRTDSSFEYFQERLHLWDVDQAAVGSPFDYYHNTLLYIPVDIPQPNTGNYSYVLAHAIIELAKQIKGRTLVLFTAYSQLKQTADIIKKPLSEAGISTYQQGSGASRRQLLENFKTADQAVLLGTRSFWEGVDVPGPKLSCVVITKIPFAVPSDPVISARSETFNDAFSQYTIPLAVLTFRQGFGRLNRTKDDRGVVVIFDSRVIHKNYGRAFIDSLPEVTEYRGPLANLSEMAQQWIDKENLDLGIRS
jgi:DNA polymerase-3 subunit epsilon/ATP-dependent DNA helicase DinG